jgi:hypothetical protein
MRPVLDVFLLASLLAIGAPATAEDQTACSVVLTPADDLEAPLPQPKPRRMHSEP